MVKISLPPDLYGGDPAGLLNHLGLVVDRKPAFEGGMWTVSASGVQLVQSQVLHGPALSRSRFDVSSAPTPGIPGGMPSGLLEAFNAQTKILDGQRTLSSVVQRIIDVVVAVADRDVPQAIQWGSSVLTGLPLVREDGTSEPLFPRHSVHDIRVDDLAYRWAKLPQMMLRLRYNTVAEIIEMSKKDPDSLSFSSSSALLEGTVFGGVYFAPLLSILSPAMWGFGVPRIGQVVIYTFGRQVGGRSRGAPRDLIDTLDALTHHSPTRPFDVHSLDPASLHKAAYSEAVDWWASRIDDALGDLFSPTTYVDEHDVYRPDVHQRWMLNFEQLLSRISAIGRHPCDQAAQLMVLFPTMDILGDSFTGSNGIGQLMTPSRLRKCVAAVSERVPGRIRPLIMAPAYRALAAAEDVASEFLVASPDPDATPESRTLRLWNARRNTTHGFNKNAEILAEHTGRLPADIVLVPMVYLLDILTDRKQLLDRISRDCRAAAAKP